MDLTYYKNMTNETMPPIQELYKKSRVISFWLYVSIAYVLFILLLTLYRPQSLSAIVSIWALPLFIIGFIAGCITRFRNDIFSTILGLYKWIHYKITKIPFPKDYTGTAVISHLLNMRKPKGVLKDIFGLEKKSNKIRFTYFVVAVTTICLMIVLDKQRQVKLPESYSILIIEFIFYAFFAYDLSARVGLDVKRSLKKWLIKRIISKYYRPFDNIYSDEQLLIWLKASIRFQHQKEKIWLPQKIVFVIGEKIEYQYFKLDDEDKLADNTFSFPRGYNYFYLYKVYNGKVTKIASNDPVSVSQKGYSKDTIDSLEYFNSSSIQYIKITEVKNAFEEIGVDISEVSILQWQVFISSKLKGILFNEYCII